MQVWAMVFRAPHYSRIPAFRVVWLVELVLVGAPFSTSRPSRAADRRANVARRLDSTQQHRARERQCEPGLLNVFPELVHGLTYFSDLLRHEGQFFPGVSHLVAHIMHHLQHDVLACTLGHACGIGDHGCR